jgi:hypothetical protein
MTATLRSAELVKRARTAAEHLRRRHAPRHSFEMISMEST